MTNKGNEQDLNVERNNVRGAIDVLQSVSTFLLTSKDLCTTAQCTVLFVTNI